MWEERLKIYDKLITSHPEIKRKGKTMPYTSANGYMFSQLNKAGQIGIRLPKEAKEEFINTYQATAFKSYGAVMKDYVLVPDELLAKTDVLKFYLDIAYQYVLSLPPK